MGVWDQATKKDGKLGYECICGKFAKSQSKELKEWQMQHFHFADGDVDVLTCDECKKQPLMDIYEKWEKKQRAN